MPGAFPCGALQGSTTRAGQPHTSRGLLPAKGRCGTKEMMQPCLIYLHVISLVAALKGMVQPCPIHLLSVHMSSLWLRVADERRFCNRTKEMMQTLSV